MTRSFAALLRSSSYAICLLIAFISAASTSRLNAAGYTLKFPNWIQISGPDTPADAPAWLAAMQAYRIQQAALLSYDDSVYKFAPLNWTQHNPIQPQAMPHDRYLYDVTTGTYTVGKYLADVRTRYGGIDSILIWPTYTNMGVDSRNQDQLIRDMPGFPNGVKQMIADFHKNDVKVLFPYNPWDIGTHDPGAAWSEVLPKTMAEIGADGMNGDTQEHVDNEFFQNSLIDKQPLALEPELGVATGPFFIPPTGPYQQGWDNKPVTWVSVADAQAYASWAGHRLPNDWEWQYAAQGTDGRLYPWGNTFISTNVPPVNTGRDTAPPTDVTAFPSGASPFGVLDMVGNVWQWTNTFSDQLTATPVVRGGSPYEPQTSSPYLAFYFPCTPAVYQLNYHNKYLLMAPSLDRSGEIGFRTAADAQP